MQVRTTQAGDCVVVHLIGKLDVETAVPFRRACMEHLAGKKVIFNFKDLNFVGSSGILPFLETMQDFLRINPNGFRFCAVGSEFKKVLSATVLGAVEIFENESLAAVSFQNAQNVSDVNTQAAVAAVPKHQPRAIMEGINPIFLTSTADGIDESVELIDSGAETEASDEA